MTMDSAYDTVLVHLQVHGVKILKTCCFGLQLSHILLKWFIWVLQEGMVAVPTMWPWLWPHSWLSLSWSNFEIAMFQEWEGRLTLNERDGGLSFMTMTLTFWWLRWSVRIYRTVTGVTLDVDVLLTRLMRFQPWSVDFPHFGGILTLSKAGQIGVSRHFLGSKCWCILTTTFRTD